MPKIHLVTTPNGVIKVWNLDFAVGKTKATRGMNVKLVQHLLYTAGCAEHRSYNLLGNIDGIWGTKSAGGLMYFEESNKGKVTQDGVVDSMAGWGMKGGSTGLFYKIWALNMLYFKYKKKIPAGEALWSGLWDPDDVSQVILDLSIDEQCASDLRDVLAHQRDKQKVG